MQGLITNQVDNESKHYFMKLTAGYELIIREMMTTFDCVVTNRPPLMIRYTMH